MQPALGHSGNSLPTRPLSDLLGVEVVGTDVRHIVQQGAATPLLSTLAAHSIVVFRDQTLTAADFVELSRLLGELEWHVLDQYRMSDHPEIYVISNITENGKPIGNPKDGFGWHTDQAYLARPTAYTLLYGAETPQEGADTLFVSTHDAYERLSSELRQTLKGRRAVQSYRYMREGNQEYRKSNAVTVELRQDQRDRVPNVSHPLVRTNPINGRLSLYLGGDSLASIEGLDDATGRSLIDELFSHTLKPDFVYHHKWQPRDVVIWDNRGSMHTATEYDRDRYRRLIWRTSVRGEIPY